MKYYSPTHADKTPRRRPEVMCGGTLRKRCDPCLSTQAATRAPSQQYSSEGSSPRSTMLRPRNQPCSACAKPGWRRPSPAAVASSTAASGEAFSSTGRLRVPPATSWRRILVAVNRRAWVGGWSYLHVDLRVVFDLILEEHPR